MAVQPYRSADPEPTPVMRCWECDEYMSAGQRLRSTALYQAILCATCEPWVASVLQSGEDEALSR
jgi:hypothetical protein